MYRNNEGGFPSNGIAKFVVASFFLILGIDFVALVTFSTYEAIKSLLK